MKCDKCEKDATKIAVEMIEVEKYSGIQCWEPTGVKRYGCEDHDVEPEIVCSAYIITGGRQ